MGAKTEIEWCHHTFNWWWGCTKVSPACDHCYAEAWDKRTGGAHWGPHAEYRTFGDKHWAEPLRWNAAAEKAGERRRVFSLSMGDWADKRAPASERKRGFDLIRRTPWLDHLLLTKRPQNIAKMLPPDWGDGWPNVWLGTTVENQEEADRRIPHLLATPAAVRFLSCEPLLADINLAGALNDCRCGECDYCREVPGHPTRAVDWVIAGGESGHGARPMHPDWARSLRDQCAAAGIPFLFKQWGEWTPGVNVERQTGTVDTAHWFDDGWSFGRENLANTDGHIDDEPDLYRVGKKKAGRLLDGRLHDEFPTARPA